MKDDQQQPRPNIPVGVTTWLGIAGAAVQYVTALVILLVGDHTDAAIAALATATTTLVTVLGGRYAQAYAWYRDAPSVKQEDDASGEPDIDDLEIDDEPVTGAPTEAELSAMYQGERQPEPGDPVAPPGVHGLAAQHRMMPPGPPDPPYPPGDRPVA